MEFKLCDMTIHHTHPSEHVREPTEYLVCLLSWYVLYVTAVTRVIFSNFSGSCSEELITSLNLNFASKKSLKQLPRGA